MEDCADSGSYKEKIIEMIQEIEDYKFLKQLYTIIRQYIKRAGAN